MKAQALTEWTISGHSSLHTQKVDDEGTVLLMSGSSAGLIKA